MQMKKIICGALILALGLCALGYEVAGGIRDFKAQDRSVTVKGLSERDVPANKVTWPLMYKELGNDPVQMYRILEEKNQKVLAFLKAGGINEDEISVNPPTISDRQADNYGNEIMNYRYKAKSVITVTSTNVDKVRQLISRQADLMKEGIALVTPEYDSNPVTYEFTGLNDVKPEMVEEATRNARLTAEKFAADSDCKLGKIWSASQGQFSIEDRDATTPYIKHIRVVNTIQYGLK